jgi:hypothetical protein
MKGNITGKYPMIFYMRWRTIHREISYDLLYAMKDNITGKYPMTFYMPWRAI